MAILPPPAPDVQPPTPDWSTGIVGRTACPACGASAGVPCRMEFDGDVHFAAHDARVYADMGVRG